MERARVRHPFHRLPRTIEPGADPNILTAGAIGRRGGANGPVNAQSYALSGRAAVPPLDSRTNSFDPPGEESDPRLVGDSGVHGRLARTVFLLIFAAILFLSGIFIGASFTANLPIRPSPTAGGVSVPIPAPLELPTESSSAIAAPLPEPAPQPRLTDLTVADAHPAPPSPASAADGVPAGPDTGSASAPVSEEPAPSAPPIPGDSLTELPMAPGTIISASPPVSALVAATAPSRPRLSEPQRQALLSRGDAYLSAGDVASARLFYRRGADAGDGTAALRLGETFDAAFLERAGFGHVPSDFEKAVSWYRQAVELGNAEAAILLKSLRQK
jgi:hypothetical protein